MFDLSGRCALVTGGGQGVGAGIATRLAEQGARVAVNDLSGERAANTVQVITDQGGIALAAVADVTNQAEVSAAVEQVADKLGPIDILVNNAGVPPSGFTMGPFALSEPAEWDLYIAINLYGVMYCTRAVIGSMVLRSWGRVITVMSDAGRFGEPGMAAYGAAKAGAAGFIRGLSKEVGASGITCNALSLGSIEAGDAKSDDAQVRRAQRYPMGRLGRPDDVAGAAVWLASEEASWVTGQTISVNGGYVAT